MQTIIQGTIGSTRLSLVIGNESPSGRRQSAKSFVFHFLLWCYPFIETIRPRTSRISIATQGMKDSLLAHGRQGWRREDRNLHQQKNHSFSRLYHDPLAYFWQVARNVVVRQWQIYTLRKKRHTSIDGSIIGSPKCKTIRKNFYCFVIVFTFTNAPHPLVVRSRRDLCLVSMDHSSEILRRRGIIVAFRFGRLSRGERHR